MTHNNRTNVQNIRNHRLVSLVCLFITITGSNICLGAEFKEMISRLTEGVSIYAQTAIYEERLIRYGGHSEHGAPQRRTGSGDVPGEGIRGQGAASEVRGGE